MCVCVCVRACVACVRACVRARALLLLSVFLVFERFLVPCFIEFLIVLLLTVLNVFM